jgi:prevent-host-death family protein
MEITFTELRRHPGRLLEALARGEEVTLSRHGRPVAQITPMQAPLERDFPISSHPAFGMWADRGDMADPAEFVRRMRQNGAQHCRSRGHRPA